MVHTYRAESKLGAVKLVAVGKTSRLCRACVGDVLRVVKSLLPPAVVGWDAPREFEERREPRDKDCVVMI